MKERDKKAIIRIIHHIETIQNYMDGISILDEFTNDTLLQDAVVFNLVQIGEIAKTRISDDFTKYQTTIPWKKMYGFRNRLIHDYTNIIIDIVYDTVVEDLPALLIKFKELLDKTT